MKLQFLFANQIGLLYQLKAEIIVDCEAFGKGEFKTQGDGFTLLTIVVLMLRKAFSAKCFNSRLARTKPRR
ncbi:hypothetical protein [Nostoc sp. JL23]|uniref:hypothetical protein n=1 Tax=Nostoc sp. JL23 TaxID=2815394 RepID=UPI0025F6F6CB|nr:hypothetical protein [Nostoc sp. JL23]